MLTTFRPPRWFKSPHLQTIGAAVPIFSPPKTHMIDLQEDLRIPIEATSPRGKPIVEGHLHACAWWVKSRTPAPAVIILHGIAGSMESHSSMRSAVALHRAGYHAIRLEMRGAGNSVMDAPSLYHAGITCDIDRAVRFVAKDPRVSGVVVLGYSGGGSQLLKLASEWGDTPPRGVLAIASVSAPLDYTRVAAHMDKLGCFPYRFHVLRGLVDRARLFLDLHPQRAQFDAALLDTIKRFRQYDGRIIVPMHGFSDVDSYYWDASAGRWLDRITVPTLLLHSEDDPMVPIDTVRPWLAASSRKVRVKLSKHGGHIGWVGGFDETSWVKGWATSEVLAFFAEQAPAPFLFPEVGEA